MPDKRSHRGPHQRDRRLFADEQLPSLRAAVSELSWLLSRGYAEPSALKLVGDRHRLNERQRTAVGRCACSHRARRARRAKQATADDLAGAELLLDGFNVLVTVEAALGGALVLAGRDGCYRDLCSVHGTYRRVEETLAAVRLVGETTEELLVAACCWYLDSPVSNSGRLRSMLLETAAEHAWDWRVELVPDADAVLSRSAGLVASSDSVVLDRCAAWFNLTREVVDRRAGGAWIVDLGVQGDAASA